MLQLLGVPGRKTEQCSEPTGPFVSRIKFGVNVGPFRVSGLDVAVASLKAVFDEARAAMPDVVAAAKTVGMLCVRHKRNNPNSFSNHSWGAALDVFFGTRVVPPAPQDPPRRAEADALLQPAWLVLGRRLFRWVGRQHALQLAEETIRAAEGD